MVKHIYYILMISVFALFGCAEQEAAENENNEPNESYELETIVSAEEIAMPWSMTWLPDGDMLISDFEGELRRYSDGELQEDPIAGLPEVTEQGQGGLMDVALHPEYEDNGWIYIAYASSEGEGDGANTAIIRAQLEDNELVDVEQLYKAEPNSDRGQHFGGRIEFDEDRYLYFSIGDRGNRDENPQDITRDGGKIYRLYDDGSVPEDNPFVDEEDAIEAIYSYGHRNPQGMDRHPDTGEIWTHEHGPRGGDEINIIEAGNNYGWPEICFCIDYDGSEITPDTSKSGMEQPEWYWDPSIAPSGMTFVTSDRYPEWQGDLLVGSLKFNHVMHVMLDGSEVTGEEELFEDIGRVRDVRQGPDGYVYVATEGDGIIRIEPENN